MTICRGCGITLQNEDNSKEGYTNNLNNFLCERCFKIKNYNEYKTVNNVEADIVEIEKTGDLVLLVTDFLSLDVLDEVNIKNPIILVITKRDIIPREIYEEKLIKNIESKLNIVSKIIVCPKNNYNLDLLNKLINKYKKSRDVYVIGYTNAGKSTLINKMAHNYGDKNIFITTSNLPSTTLDNIKIKLNDFNLIDTPGLIDTGSIILNINKNTLDKITPKKEIKPVILQTKKNQIVVIEDILRLDIIDDTNIVFYMSNKLNINRYYNNTKKLNNLKKHSLNIEKNTDIVIKGLGFIRICNDSRINLYLNSAYKCRKSIL